MKIKNVKIALILLLLLTTVKIFALSVPIGRDIRFPQDFDPQKAGQILKVIKDERFKFVDGIVSEWEPDYGTRLSFEGDAQSLNEFVAASRNIKGIGLGVVLYRGRNEELRRDSPWQLHFSQAHPDRLMLYLNVSATMLDLSKVKLPEWPPR